MPSLMTAALRYFACSASVWEAIKPRHLTSKDSCKPCHFTLWNVLQALVRMSEGPKFQKKVKKAIFIATFVLVARMQSVETHWHLCRFAFCSPTSRADKPTSNWNWCVVFFMHMGLLTEAFEDTSTAKLDLGGDVKSLSAHGFLVASTFPPKGTASGFFAHWKVFLW